jgi:hypothetical protein
MNPPKPNLVVPSVPRLRAYFFFLLHAFYLRVTLPPLPQGGGGGTWEEGSL